jgi:hypothetical protein
MKPPSEVALAGRCVAAALILIAILLIALPSRAAKTDVIILRNGDHITGEIRKFTHGKVEFKTDDMDMVYVEWEKIHHITSVNYFETVDTHGIKRFGSIGRTEIPGEIVIHTPTATDTLPLIDIVRMTWIKSTFIQRLKGDISFGFSYTRATRTAEFTLGGKTDYRGEKWRSNLNYSAYLTDQAEKRTSRFDIGFSVDRFLRRRWTAGIGTQVEHNEELGLDRRISITGTGSRFVVETNSSNLNFGLGLSGTQETFIGSDSTSYNLELPITAAYTRFTFHDPKSDIRLSGAIIPSLTTEGRYRASIDCDFNYELLKDFFIVIGFYYDYDSQPPSGAAKDDYRFSTSLKWSFG